MSSKTYDFVIIGAGSVGLSCALTLKKRFPDCSILLLEKEENVGAHSSGRNSGVIHAGIYYEPNSIRASVCVAGALRLKEWICEHDLPINTCGKLILPQKPELYPQIDFLYERAKMNGVPVEVVDQDVIRSHCSHVNPNISRGLWSPNTAVVKPRLILDSYVDALVSSKVHIEFLSNPQFIDIPKGVLRVKGDLIYYNHLFNCAGPFADYIAHKFKLAEHLKIIPFKGTYWQLRKSSKFDIPTNIYPVPDLNVPFLGIHFTPGAYSSQPISIGPTALPAVGRESYAGLVGAEPISFLKNMATLTRLYLSNKSKFRNYVHEQLMLGLPFPFLVEAQRLIPSLTCDDIEPSPKLGIRAQLFNMKTDSFENDFLCINGDKSTHVLNAISPAFTASFALAELIVDSGRFE